MLRIVKGRHILHTKSKNERTKPFFRPTHSNNRDGVSFVFTHTAKMQIGQNHSHYRIPLPMDL